MLLPDVLCGKRRWLMLFLLANSVLQSLILIAIGLSNKLVFDSFMDTSKYAPSTHLLAVFALLIVLGVVLAWLKHNEWVLYEKMGQSYIFEVRQRLFAHLTTLSRDTAQGRSKGVVMLRLMGDLNALRQWVSLGLTRLWTASIALITTLIALAIIQWMLALTAAVVIVIGLLVFLPIGNRIRTTSQQARNYRARLATNLFEKIANIQVIQVFGQAEREQRRVSKQGNYLLDAMIERAKSIGLSRGANELTVILATASVLFVGANVVMQGEATPGTIVAAMSIIALLTPGLRDLGRVGEYWHNAVVSREQLNYFLSLPAELVDANKIIKLPAGGGCLQFNNCFAGNYLKSLTVTAPAGSRIAVVGPNGSGKSTLMLVLARLMPITQGSVMLDGVEMSSVALKQLRREVAIISPDLGLLRGSIRYNLLYRNRKLSPKKLDSILELCDLRSFIDSLEQGLDTRLTEGGRNLSVGQRQRLALARALVDNPRLLLLDEVDSNLDPGFIQTLKNVIQRFQGTVLLITQRLEMVQLTDTVWHLYRGRLVEQGNTQELLKKISLTSVLFTGKHCVQ